MMTKVMCAGLAALFLLVPACKGRDLSIEEKADDSPFAGGEQIVVFDLSKPLPESVVGPGFSLAPASQTFAAFIESTARVLELSSTRGAFLRFGTSRINWAQTQELGRLFGAARESGTRIYCHADGLSNASIWLAAAACDEIWLSPAGGVDSVGIGGQSVYVAGLLRRLEVETDFLHMGRYKSAAETVTHEGPSEAAEESMLSLLRSIRASWLDGVEAVRARPGLREALELGPWAPLAALEHNLIDHIGYESDARAALEKERGITTFVSPAKAQGKQEAAGELSALLHLLLGSDDEIGEPHVVVLPTEGAIDMAGGGPLGDGGIHARELTRVIRRLKDDDAVKAVVLRIDSPGGSALASDLLWHELVALGEKKPLIASLGGVAASGGYYMACAASTIVAEATSIVGSIGVVGGKFTLTQALAKYGVTTHTFSASDAPGAGSRATYTSLFSQWDDSTRQRVRAHMQSVYDLFLSRVAEGRKLPVEQIRKVAEGRVWSGAEGKNNGLVDELGGLALALKKAKEAAGLPPNAVVDVHGGAKSLLELLGLGAGSSEQDVRQAIGQRLRATRPGLLDVFSPAQRAYMGSFAPLVGPENVVTALPFFIEAQ